MERLMRRLELQRLLEGFAEPFVRKTDRTKHVYYNPPTGFQLEYPCYVYGDARPSVYHADNAKYFNRSAWTITVISRDPECSDLAPPLEDLPYCSVNSGSSFTTDGLAHRGYTLYY